jgi:hypothetical protein
MLVLLVLQAVPLPHGPNLLPLLLRCLLIMAPVGMYLKVHLNGDFWQGPEEAPTTMVPATDRHVAAYRDTLELAVAAGKRA